MDRKQDSVLKQLSRSRNPRDRVRARTLARLGRKMEGEVVLAALRRLAKTDSPGAGVAAGMAAPSTDPGGKGPMVASDVYTPVPGERRRPPTTRRTPYITLPPRNLPHPTTGRSGSRLRGG